MEVMFHMKTADQEAELTMNMTKNGADLQYLPWTRGFEKEKITMVIMKNSRVDHEEKLDFTTVNRPWFMGI